MKQEKYQTVILSIISYLQTFFLFSVIISPPSMNSVSSGRFSVLASRSRRKSGAVRPMEDISSTTSSPRPAVGFVTWQRLKGQLEARPRPLIGLKAKVNQYHKPSAGHTRTSRTAPLMRGHALSGLAQLAPSA